MRTSLRPLTLIFGICALLGATAFGASCASTPRVTVIHGAPAEPIKGDPLKFKRGAQEAYAGADPGFHVVRTRDDWRRVWANAKETPALPPTLDLSRQMVLLGIADSKDATRIEFVRAVETAEILHVFVRETKAGPGCKGRLEQPAFEAVVSQRIDKPVKFFVEDVLADGCGDPPLARIKCRLGESQTWSEKVTAQPGDKVECELTAETRGTFAIVDRAIGFTEVPGGSGAKLAYSRGAARGSFEVDVFGTYTVTAEAIDEAGRKGTAAATVEVVPPRTKDALVQLIWTNFDAADDPSTFPRTNLRSIDDKLECTAARPNPPQCDVKKHSAYTHMTIKAGEKKLPLSVEYVDERVDKGPLACIQVYFDGKRSSEMCDRTARAAGDRWEVGVLDLSNGSIGEPLASVADAGVEDAGKPAPGKKPAPAAKPAAKDGGK